VFIFTKQLRNKPENVELKEKIVNNH